MTCRAWRSLRDDILVIGSGDNLEEATIDHDENLLKLLKRAHEVNLKFNSKKVNLRKPEVKYMGHVLSSEGLKPDPNKVNAVSEMPKPTYKQEALGLWICELPSQVPSTVVRDLTANTSADHQRCQVHLDKTARRIL